MSGSPGQTFGSFAGHGFGGQPSSGPGGYAPGYPTQTPAATPSQTQPQQGYGGGSQPNLGSIWPGVNINNGGAPQQQGGSMQQPQPQNYGPMGGFMQQPQFQMYNQQPPSFAQLFGGAMNNGGQSIGYYSGRGGAMNGGSQYGAPYGTFPGGMGGSGGNMWPGPANKGPIADPAPGAGAMGGAMTPVVNKDPAFSAQNAALNFGNGVNNGYFNWGGR